MEWNLICLYPKVERKISEFPFCVGREPVGFDNYLSIDNPSVSHSHFILEADKDNKVIIRNLAEDNPVEINGTFVKAAARLNPESVYLLRCGSVFIALGTNYYRALQLVAEKTKGTYVVEYEGQKFGPLTEDEISQYCADGTFSPSTKAWSTLNQDEVMQLRELIDFDAFDELEQSQVSMETEKKRLASAEEREVELGESFMCPYCRTVSDLEDVLSVAVSPSLRGDAVLGEAELKRFLPTQFTVNGLALDSEGGVCTEIACPRCHMALPRTLLDTPQIIMSVVGAPSAGKSVFLASSIWQCRQTLSRRFGVSFMDLDPVANKWINAYEEKLFFQEDDVTLQKIEKTDINSSVVCKSVRLDGEDVLLPLPSFFQLRSKQDDSPRSLVVYDSAGEHFRAGADTQSSAVTLNMLNADTLFFMFDPSADPRFRSMLNRGSGTARSTAQRQDVLLAEMAARIKRHMGNRSQSKLEKPLIFGVSKADLLDEYLPLDAPIYTELDNKKFALNLSELKKLSETTEELLNDVVPEVVETAHDIAEEVWFVPISALGHNPMLDGVRPCDIKPKWTELPIVFTLAKKGLVATI